MFTDETLCADVGSSLEKTFRVSHHIHTGQLGFAGMFAEIHR